MSLLLKESKLHDILNEMKNPKLENILCVALGQETDEICRFY